MHIKQVLLFALGLSYAVFSHAVTYEWVDEKALPIMVTLFLPNIKIKQKR